jgi:hypothetical protein
MALEVKKNQPVSVGVRLAANLFFDLQRHALTEDFKLSSQALVEMQRSERLTHLEQITRECIRKAH